MVRATKTEKIVILNPHGKYLGYSGTDLIVRKRDRTKEKRTSIFKVGEVILQSGNAVSTGALSAMMFWGIDVLILTASGKPVGTMYALDDGSHVKTRLCQYEAYKNRKGVEIAKQFVLGKIEAQSQMLKKYELEGFETLNLLSKERIGLMYAENVDRIRTKLHGIEGKYSEHYWKQIIPLFPKFLQIKKREGYRAYDKLNNLFNFAYEFLKWKIFRALIKAKLEPYLGFLHRISFNHPTLVSDFMELYRCLIDDFLIRYSRTLRPKDFEKCFEKGYYNKKMPRMYLNHSKTNGLVKVLSKYFESKVECEPIRGRGKRQSLETLISQEALSFAMFLRNERESWIPRIVFP